MTKNAEVTKTETTDKSVVSTKLTQAEVGEKHIVRGSVVHINERLVNNKESKVLTILDRETREEHDVFLSKEQIRGFGLNRLVQDGTDVVVTFLKVTPKNVFIDEDGKKRHYDKSWSKFVRMRMLAKFEDEELSYIAKGEILSKFESVAPHLANAMRGNAVNRNVFADVE